MRGTQGRHVLFLLLIVFTALALAACGGGGGGDGGDTQTEASPPPADDGEDTTTDEEAEEEEEEEGVTVPEVVGQSEDEATEALEDEGFEVEPVTTGSLEEQGSVIAQDPEAGDEGEEGDEVEIQVSEGPQEYLLSLIPSKIRATCNREPLEFPATALAKVQCAPPNRQAHVVQYNLFQGRNAMNQAYRESLDGVENQLEFRLPRRNDCQRDVYAEHPWQVGGNRGGRVFCYDFEDQNQTWIEWTNQDLNVYTFAWRTDRQNATLYRWWSNIDFSHPQPPGG